jgi:hypothetical protein
MHHLLAPELKSALFRCHSQFAMKPRLALPADIEAVTNVIINAMPLDPQWDYRFPYRDQYPKDHYKFTRMLFEYFLDPSYDDWLVMVVEDSLRPGQPTEVVSFGVWDISYLNKRRYGPGYRPQDRKSLLIAAAAGSACSTR